MTQFKPADALDLLDEWDNEIHEGKLGTVRVRRISDTESLVTFTPWDEDGESVPDQAVTLVVAARYEVATP